MRIAQILIDNAKKYAQEVAIIFEDESISFLQVKDNAFKLAEGFLSLGLKKSDKVAIYLPNCPQYFYSYLAIWSCGLTAVPLDFMLTEEEIISFLKHSEAKVMIIQPKPNINIEMIKSNCPHLKEIIVTKEKIEGCFSLDELMGKGKPIPVDIETDPKDYAAIFYTSGSTGRPKGVLTNYLQIEAPAKAMSYFVDLNDKDIALCALPLSHLGGLVFVQGLVYLGTRVVLMERFIPLEFLRNIQKYKVTSFWLVPPMYYAILQLKEFEYFDFSSLRFITVFGAPGSLEKIKRFHKYCPNAKLYHGWGMTETQGPTVVTAPDSEKIESVGKPLPWVEVKIFDENDKEVPVGQVGEIVIRGEQICEGYYKDPELTRQTIRDGWFHTGDLGKFDEDGDLYIVGRKKEMIKVAGEIVFEPEVEALIMRHPDVAECAVIGVPDRLRGEVPYAFVVLKENSKLNEESLRQFCRKHLAHFKIPHYFKILKELPKTRSGKINKSQLKEIIKGG